MGGKKHMTDIMFVITLFCVFAVSALTVMLLGSNVYKKIVTNTNNNFDTRTSLIYISTKIHQNDRAGSVYLAELEDITALFIEQDIGDEVYLTVIFHDAGYIKEIFTEKNNDFDKSYGKEIIKSGSLTFADMGDKLIKLVNTNAGVTDEMIISLRTDTESINKEKWQ